MITPPLPARPSKSLWPMSWSSTSTAKRLTVGSIDGPFGTAHERITPSTSSRTSKWCAVARCSCTTNTPAGTPRIANCSWPSTRTVRSETDPAERSVEMSSSIAVRSPSAWTHSVPSSISRTQPSRPSLTARERTSSRRAGSDMSPATEIRTAALSLTPQSSHHRVGCADDRRRLAAHAFLYLDDHPTVEIGVLRVGPSWEIYGHWREDPSELETEVYYLVQ